MAGWRQGRVPRPGLPREVEHRPVNERRSEAFWEVSADARTVTRARTSGALAAPRPTAKPAWPSITRGAHEKCHFAHDVGQAQRILARGVSSPFASRIRTMIARKRRPRPPLRLRRTLSESCSKRCAVSWGRRPQAGTSRGANQRPRPGGRRQAISSESRPRLPTRCPLDRRTSASTNGWGVPNSCWAPGLSYSPTHM